MNQRIRRILLTDHYNSYNRGDAAILDGMLIALREECPDASFVVVSDYPEVAGEAHGIPALAWGVMGYRSRSALAGWLARSLAWTLLARLGWPPDGLLVGWERPLMAAYRQADLVIASGGSYLRTGYRSSWLRLWQMLLAKLLGRKVMLYAQSIGPFDPGSRLERWAALVLDRVDAITLRDAESARVLQRMGVSRPRIEVTADAALCLAPPNVRRDAAGRPEIGVSVIHWHKFRLGSMDAYTAAVAEALDHLIVAWDARVQFLSTTVAPPGLVMNVSGTGFDDRAAAEQVLARMQHRQRATLQEGPLSVSALHARIAEHDLWIGTRLHSTILATTALVPCVGIAYEPKMYGYFAELGLEEFVLDIDTLSAADLVAAAKSARRQAAAIRSQLETHLVGLRVRAWRSAIIARELLEEVPGTKGTPIWAGRRQRPG